MEVLSNSQAEMATKSRTETHLHLSHRVKHICAGKTPFHLHKITLLLCNLCVIKLAKCSHKDAMLQSPNEQSLADSEKIRIGFKKDMCSLLYSEIRKIIQNLVN